MAGFIRGKQSGVQNDLSATIPPGIFTPDEQSRYGINSQLRYRSSPLRSGHLSSADWTVHEHR